MIEHKTLLYGVKIFDYADYKNLSRTNADSVSARAQHQKMLLDEHRCELICIKREKTELADAMSKLGTTSKNDVEKFEDVCRLRKVFENEVLILTDM